MVSRPGTLGGSQVRFLPSPPSPRTLIETPAQTTRYPVSNTILPKASPTPVIDLSDEQISYRVNIAITTARAKNAPCAYVDLGLDPWTTPCGGGPLGQRVLGMLAEKGYTDASLDGRSCQIEIPL